MKDSKEPSKLSPKNTPMQNSKKTKRDTPSTKRFSINCNFLSHMKIHWGIRIMTRKSMMYWIQRWKGMWSTLKANWSRIIYSARAFPSSYLKNLRSIITINTKDKIRKKKKRILKRKRKKKKKRLTQLHLFNLLPLHQMYHQQEAKMLLVIPLYNRFRPGKFVPKLKNDI